MELIWCRAVRRPSICKNPVKFRFIIGARNCVTKQVAKKLVKILQLIMKIHGRYCNKIKFYTGIKRFWIIENNAQVLEDIKLINSKRNARNIKTFDFSTLYIKIPLDDLKEKLKEIVDKAFKGGHNKYIQLARLQDGSTARRMRVLPRKISSAWSTWLLIIHFSNLGTKSSDNPLVYLWVLIQHHKWPICTCTNRKLSSWKCSPKKTTVQPRNSTTLTFYWWPSYPQ